MLPFLVTAEVCEADGVYRIRRLPVFGLPDCPTAKEVRRALRDEPDEVRIIGYEPDHGPYR